MVGRTLTRADLKAAVYETAEITEHEVSALVELVLAEITKALAKGETVKLASFGIFSTRQKGGRIGRNPNRSGGADLAKNGCGLPSIAGSQGARAVRLG